MSADPLSDILQQNHPQSSALPVEEQLLSTRDKVIQVSGYCLIAIAAIILSISVTVIAYHILAGASAAGAAGAAAGIESAGAGESLFSVGIATILAGAHLLRPSPRAPSVRLGPLSISADIV